MPRVYYPVSKASHYIKYNHEVLTVETWAKFKKDGVDHDIRVKVRSMSQAEKELSMKGVR